MLVVAILVLGCSCGQSTPVTDSGGDAWDAAMPFDVRDEPEAGLDAVWDALEIGEEVTTTPDVFEVGGDNAVDADPGADDDGSLACDCAPPTVKVTVNGIPDSMNGSQPYLANSGQMESFILAVPTYGFSWDVKVDCPCGCAKEGLKAWTDPAPDSAGELAPLFEPGEAGVRSWIVDEQHALPEADVLALNASMTDECGQESPTASLDVRTVTMTPMLDPFDLEDPWLIVYGRDFYEVGWALDPAGKVEILSKEGSNGVSDFLEDLWTIGLGSPNPTKAFSDLTCEGGQNGNECLGIMFLDKLRSRMYPMFKRAPDGTGDGDSVNIRVWIEGEAGAPSPADFAYQYLDGSETAKSFSMIGIGGGNPDAGYLGLSESLDQRNVRNENNAKKDYGVLTTSLIHYFYKLIFADPSMLNLAQMFMGDMLPPLGGVPVGEKEGDELVVDMSIPDEDLAPEVADRRVKMEAAMDLMAGGLAALTAHEIGHSLWLVPYGAPPNGFFANEKKAAFIEHPGGSEGPHIDTEGQNIMQAGPGSGNMPVISIGFLLDPWFFNEINLAYLQGRVVLLPK